MIRSSDYWATLLLLALLGAFTYSIRRANRQIQADRAATLHASTVRQLGDGERVVLSVGCSSGLPCRATIGQTHRVYGFAHRADMAKWLGASGNGDNLPDPRSFGGVPLHHPSLR